MKILSAELIAHLESEVITLATCWKLTLKDATILGFANLIAGCDKIFAMRKETYNNAVNFRGEPHIPGTDALFNTASMR